MTQVVPLRQPQPEYWVILAAGRFETFPSEAAARQAALRAARAQPGAPVILLKPVAEFRAELSHVERVL